MSEMFSPIETKVLKLLGKRKLTIGELTEEFFFKSGIRSLNPGAVVSAAVLRINKKCKFHGLNWLIEGEGLGRGGKTVKIGKKK
jgi:hypothetical protein